MSKKRREDAVEFDILNEYWDDHDGFDIEKSMKAKLGGLYGYVRTSATIDASNFYHLECFRSAEDAAEYDADREGKADLLLNDIVIPISTVQGDSYAAYLFSKASQSSDIVVAEASMPVEFRFHAVRISNGERLNMGTKGTLTVQRSLDEGRTWITVGTLEGVINSTDYTNTTTYETIDLGQFLQKGYKQLIRVRASFPYNDDSGIERVGYSTWTQIGSSVTYAELSLECLLGWHTPLMAANIKSVGFPVSYIVNGAVQKTLHIQIQGATGVLEVNYELDSSQNGVPFSRDISDAANTYKIFNHGIRTVTAWLTCDDGLGGELSSDVLVNRFMVIDKGTASNPNAPFLMLQNVVSRVVNYVQTKICDYAVFVPSVDAQGEITPSSEPIDVTFYLTSYSASFPDDPNVKEYYAFESSVQPNVKNSLVTTVEIESEDEGDVQSYFRIWRNDGGTMRNFMQESMGLGNINIAVDNSDSFSPTLGATFVINPKVRNNSEGNPARILNAQSNNAEVESTWEGFDFVNDGWVTATDGVKVLRILAGEKLNIKFNPFVQFLTTPDSSMTLDLDFCVRNVTNEDDPIISIFEKIIASVTTNYRGLMIKPMEGNIYTKSNTIDSETNFRFREEVRTHISLNIHNAVVPNINGDGLYDPTKFTPASSIALVRVLVNGNIEREMKFNITARDEFCTGALSNGGITIGQDGADIDIYSLRCYANRQLTAQNVVKNYIATLPTAEEKLRVRTENDIMTGGRVDVEKVKALGKRVLILHGAEPYFYNTSVASVWWEIFQYDENKQLIKELSGTICKQTGIKPKRQGSTANTYYYSNIQTKVDDGGMITIPISMFHPSITVSEPYEVEVTDEATGETTTKTVVGIYGGNLGKYDPVKNEAKEYDYANGMVSVPDGWIDGNGLYRGMGFMITENTPLATKLVLKVNYASSMQSHLCAGTRLYNDLHTRVVGKNSLQEAVSTARVSKYTEPVFFFTQDGDGTPVFRGGGNFGAGKMDKPTWGYVKKLHPMFTMIEGSDNNYPLTDFRVPFTIDPDCSERVTYSADDEGYFYNGLQCLDFDAGKTDDDDVPVDALRDRIMEVWNFIYMHSPMLKYYVGTFDQFKISDEAKNTNRKYWCTDGADAYRLKRYDFVNAQWVDAGLWSTLSKSFSIIDIRTHEYTASTYNASEHKADYELLNKELIAAIASHAKKYIGWYFNVKSLQFHYAFQNHFMAGTDNCSKNTYFVIDPKAKNVTIDGVTKECYLIELHQDDVDTISLTDNNGRSTKPYYIDRMHPYDDKDASKTTSCYEGMYNVLFNLVEEMYEESRELQSMLKSIFTAMVGLVTTADNAKGYTSSIWGCLQKYMFSIQHYYPAMAYNEQARIRYEWPALLGFVSQGSGARSIAPITQSMGSQLEAEMQFMIRRVIYMASYAAWGNFYDAGKTYNIGIADAADSFSLQAFHLPNETTSNNRYAFHVKPHQYIYPTGMLGQTSIDPHVRVAPNEDYLLNLGNTESNDTGLSILGINYYRSVGNVGDISVSPNVTFEVKGKRLVEFVAEPTIIYTDESDGKKTGAFRPNQLNISAVQVQRFSLKNSGIAGTLNVEHLTRLSSLDIRGTYIYDIELPKSEAVSEVHLPETLTSLRLVNQPNLETFTLDGGASIAAVEMAQEKLGKLDTGQVMQNIYLDKAEAGTAFSSIKVTGIDWSGIRADMMTFMAGAPSCVLTGAITMLAATNDRYLTFAEVVNLITLFGDIQSQSNSLYIDYPKRSINTFNIKGLKYIKTLGEFKGWILNIQPTTGNNVAIADGHEDVSWAFVGDNANVASTYAEFTDSVKGTINVKKLSDPAIDLRFTIRVQIKLTDGTVMSMDKKVGFYNRIPKVGDFAYVDGSFDDEYDKSKTLAGAVVKKEKVSDTEYKLWVYAKENAVCKSTDGTLNTSGLPWGIYPEASANNGFPASVYDEIARDAELTSAVDTAMANIGTGGMTTAYIPTGGFTDDTKDDGFTEYGSNVAVGDFDTENKNAIVLAHANAIINGHLQESYPKTMTELADAIRALETEKESGGDTKSTRWRQLFYPAIYACHLYEPTVEEGEDIDEQFECGHWMLPATGLLARIYNFFYNSCNKVTLSAGGSCKAEYANENPESEAQLPLFANILARIALVQSAGSPFAMPTNSNYWSVTEYGSNGAWGVNFGNGSVTYYGGYKYNGHSVRPVAAFTFNL